MAAAAAAAAAVGLVAAYWPARRLIPVGVVSPGPSTTRVATTAGPPTTVAPVVVPTTVAPVVVPTTATAPTTAPPVSATTVPPSPAVPAGFAPQSVTFVSAEQGWVAGAAPCPTGSCLALAHTRDGGRTWSAAPAPPVTLTAGASSDADVAVRFADANDGWIYVRQPLAVWSSHDGGAAWHQVGIPGLTAGATIMDMEAGAKQVQIAVIPANSSAVHLAASPVSSDEWVDIDTGVAVGGGPVPAAQLVLQDSQGWLLENDRTVIGGARLNGTGAWITWTPPCRTANGTASAGGFHAGGPGRHVPGRRVGPGWQPAPGGADPVHVAVPVQ